MNASLKPQYLMTQVTGQLLHAGYQFNDDLVLDLYGSHDADDGYMVESVALAGTTIELVSLFRGKQLENMGYWLDLKDGSTEQQRWAGIHMSQAQSLG